MKTEIKTLKAEKQKKKTGNQEARRRVEKKCKHFFAAATAAKYFFDEIQRLSSIDQPSDRSRSNHGPRKRERQEQKRRLVYEYFFQSVGHEKKNALMLVFLFPW